MSKGRKGRMFNGIPKNLTLFYTATLLKSKKFKHVNAGRDGIFIGLFITSDPKVL